MISPPVKCIISTTWYLYPMLHIPLVYIRAFALVSHVSVLVATVFSLYEDERRPFGREPCHFVQLVIGS